MTLACVSDQQYQRTQEIGSLIELADYSRVTVGGTRVGGKIVIPEFITFELFSARADSKLQEGGPERTARMRFEDYAHLRDTYRVSSTRNPQVDALVSMAESYM